MTGFVRGPNLFIVLAVVAWQAVLPFVPVAGQRLGMEPAAIGLLIGVQGVAALAIVFPAGLLIARLGAHRFVQWGAVGCVAALLMLWLRPSVSVFFVALPLLGACQMIEFMAAQMLVLAGREQRGRDHAVGMFLFYTSVGVTLGPALGSLAVRTAGALSAAFLVGTAASILALASVALVRPVPPVSGPSPGRLFADIVPLSYRVKVSLLAVGVGDFFYMAWSILLPLAMTAAGHTPSTIGWVFAVRGAATTLIRPGLGVILTHVSRDVMTAASLAAMSAGFLLSTGTARIELTLIGSAAFGLGTGLVFPLSLLLMTGGIAIGRMPHLLSIRQFVGKLGQIVGPVVTGVLASASQTAAVAGVACLGFGAAAWVYARREASPPAAEAVLPTDAPWTEDPPPI